MAKKEEIADVIKALGIKKDTVYNTALTPLMNAAYNGQKEVVELLIANGADVNAKSVGGNNEGSTALMFAAQAGQKEVVELLIAKGADVNARSTDGETPLMYAVQCAGVFHPDVFGVRSYAKNLAIQKATMKVLIANGADVNARDNKGKTAADWAPGADIKEMLRNPKVPAHKKPMKLR